MDDLKVIFASNLISLRTQAGMTQIELGERLNYSDKSVSKWERAEAIPDVTVVKAIATIFGVSVDYLLESHDQWKPETVTEPSRKRFNANLIIAIAGLGIITLATLIFVIFWMMGDAYWLIYAATVPVFLVTMLVLNSIWNKRKHNVIIVLLLILSVFALMYFIFIDKNPWQIVFILIPSEIIAYLSFKFKRRNSSRKNHKK